MLSPVEQILFIVLAVAAVALAARGFLQMFKIVNRGEGKLALDGLVGRAVRALGVYLSQRTTLKKRRLVSILHFGVVWGFTFYFLVNFGDVLEGYFKDLRFLGDSGLLAGLYRLAGDVLSVAVLVGVAYFLIRRFILQDTALKYRDNVLLHPNVAKGQVRRDSLIVGVFILCHVGSRFVGQSVQVAMGTAVGPQPFATALSGLWAGLPLSTLEVLDHVFWWSALALILGFLPYFPYTKHAHLFMAPLNFLTKPERTSLGEMEPEDFEDEKKEQFGANKLEHLARTALMDGFSCIMCNRCQDVCPAYTTGKELSPSAYEVNKRYLMKAQMSALAAGKESAEPLVGSAISQSAVWACTSCGACIDVCPVGNEPMLDILDIRRDLVLVQAEFPAELKGAFNGMERQANPWQLSDSRLKWAEGLDVPVPTVEDNPDFEILYWVGCAPSYEPRAQQTARAFVKLLHKAHVNFAVLGERECCTGDTARRAGNEFLYAEMAKVNVETLNEVKPKRIVVTCPHCLHNIGKEYHQFGGNYKVVHHTELIEELISEGRLPKQASPLTMSNVTFHDPCYLGRHNGVVEAPRQALEQGLGIQLVEMARNKNNSFCCGAGGAQFWKEEEHGTARVNITRYEEAKATGAETLAVGCPFCMRMFVDASGEVKNGPRIKDVAELILERIEAAAPEVKA